MTKAEVLARARSGKTTTTKGKTDKRTFLGKAAKEQMRKECGAIGYKALIKAGATKEQATKWAQLREQDAKVKAACRKWLDANGYDTESIAKALGF